MFKLRREQKEALASEFGTVGMLAPCQYCLVVRIVEIRGLYKPGIDDRVNPPPGTTKGASYQEGYLSEDDRGRIFINRDAAGNWKKHVQGVEITVRVDPPSVPIPPGTKITWTFDDPDDPINENPEMHRSAAVYLDPNDYDGTRKIGEKGNDNAPDWKARFHPGFKQLEPRYPLTGNETPVDPLTRLSKVRFDVSDIAGDNYRVRAVILHPIPPIQATVPAQTGVMTVWNRIDVEYLKMEHARELPIERIAPAFEPACAQIDISLKREIVGLYDLPVMGHTKEIADAMLEHYASSRSTLFTKEHEPGWFLLVAARGHFSLEPEFVLFEGDVFADNQFIRFPEGHVLQGDPTIVRIYNPAKKAEIVAQTTGAVPHFPKSIRLQASFGVPDVKKKTQTFLGNFFLQLAPNDYFDVFQYSQPSLRAFLTDYGFAMEQTIKVQVAGGGGGYANGVSLLRYGYFSGRVFIFTDLVHPDYTAETLIHELAHAFENTHQCGNWSWVGGAERHSCCLSYAGEFVLDDASPRRPIPWTQARRSFHFCPQHLRRLRDFPLADNPGYAWRDT